MRVGGQISIILGPGYPCGEYHVRIIEGGQQKTLSPERIFEADKAKGFVYSRLGQRKQGQFCHHGRYAKLLFV